MVCEQLTHVHQAACMHMLDERLLVLWIWPVASDGRWENQRESVYVVPGLQEVQTQKQPPHFAVTCCLCDHDICIGRLPC